MRTKLTHTKAHENISRAAGISAVMAWLGSAWLSASFGLLCCHFCFKQLYPFLSFSTVSNGSSTQRTAQALKTLSLEAQQQPQASNVKSHPPSDPSPQPLPSARHPAELHQRSGPSLRPRLRSQALVLGCIVVRSSSVTILAGASWPCACPRPCAVPAPQP